MTSPTRSKGSSALLSGVFEPDKATAWYHLPRDTSSLGGAHALAVAMELLQPRLRAQPRPAPAATARHEPCHRYLCLRVSMGSASSATMKSAPMPPTTEPSAHVRVRHPVTVQANGVPRVPKPRAIEVRPPSPGRDIPSPTVRGRVEIRIRNAIQLRRRRSVGDPNPAMARQVHPLTGGIRLNERRLVSWRRRGRPLR